MKKHISSVILLIVGSFTSGFASEEQTPDTEATAARIVGALQDGTPPPPTPPKPAFIVPAKDILDTITHQQGGRTITVHEIKSIALPPPPEAPAQIDLNDPVVQQRIALRRAKYPAMKMLLVGATVYRSEDAPPRTLVRLWPQAQGEPVTLWSSADFALLSGLPTFTISSGESASLMMMWSITDLNHENALSQKFARQFVPPKIPLLPDGKATFIVTEGNPTEETLVSIRSLHDIYNSEHDRLLAAYQGRERARIAQEAELKAHPPKPKDIVLSYWNIGTADPTEGGAK